MRREGNIAAVRRNRRDVDGFAVGLDLVVGKRDPFGDPGVAVMDKGIPALVGVAVDQVGCAGVEGHVAAIGVDRRLMRAAIGLAPIAGDADPFDAGLQAVADEDIELAVGVAWHQVRCIGDEDDEAAVGAERRRIALRVVGHRYVPQRELVPQVAMLRLAAVVGQAHPFGDAILPVMHEDVPGLVGIARHQVVGRRDEGDEAAVGADRRISAPAVALVAAGGDADAFGDACLPVVDEDVVVAVGVVRDQVAGRRGEGDEAAIGRDGRAAQGNPVALAAVRGDTDPGKIGGCEGEGQRQQGDREQGFQMADFRWQMKAGGRDPAVGGASPRPAPRDPARGGASL